MQLFYKSCHISLQNISRCRTCISRIISFRCYNKNMAEQVPFFKNKKGNQSTLRHVKLLQKIKENRNENDSKKGPSVFEIQVIGTGHPGTPRSIMINTGLVRYLFNCGGGTQRICLANKMKPSRFTDFFFTQQSWDNFSGLLGMCLTMENMDVPGIRIHGPPNVTKAITESKGFAQINRLKVESQDLSEGSYNGIDVDVHYIPMMPIKGQDGEPAPKKTRLNQDNLCVAYLVKAKPKARNVDMEKCANELGITRGVIIGQLQKGNPVTLENGRTIQPEDILTPIQPNKPVLILECPSVEHLDSLLENSRIQKLTASVDPDDSPCCIFHMTADHILMDPKYQAWIQKFTDSTTHIILNEKCSGINIESVYRIQTVLNLIHPHIFPLLPPETPSEPLLSTASNIIYGKTGMKYIARGKGEFSVNCDQCISLDEEAYINEICETEDGANVKALENLSEILKKQENKSGDRYPEVLFLGTGSAEPNKTRNVSAIWVQVSADKCLLLDCGENTLGQIIRFFGDRANDMILKLEAIFISHLHTDHHLGTLTVAKYRQELIESEGLKRSQLVIVAPSLLQNWYHTLFEISTDLTSLLSVVPISTFYANYIGKRPAAYKDLLNLLDMSLIKSVRVKHAAIPHGMVLVHKSGWKLVYSGDTMPCEALIEAGKNCDLLLHEATMEDDMEEEALRKRHSTTSQAIQVGMDMGAKFIMLTHFSQRYSKIPLFNDNFSDRIGIAFDNMRVCQSEVQVLPLLLPTLKQIFSKEYEILEERKAKRAYGAIARERDGDNKVKGDIPPIVNSQKQPSGGT